VIPSPPLGERARVRGYETDYSPHLNPLPEGERRFRDSLAPAGGEGKGEGEKTNS
jgi:hypothetical protein